MQVRWRQKDITPKSSQETSGSWSDYTIHEAKVAPKLQCSRGILLFSLQNGKRQMTASMVTNTSFLRRVVWNFERESFNSTTDVKFPDLKDLHIHEEKVSVRFSSPYQCIGKDNVPIAWFVYPFRTFHGNNLVQPHGRTKNIIED